ncbi:MAG: FAD-dependent oxidoreductase, partial [Acidobacteria bacterium]|nr:FAD-dependent oxidoreductase [Acidobacteriota bacterium]
MAEIKVYGKPWCIETGNLLRLLNYNNLNYDYIEIMKSADIPEDLKEQPGVVFKDGMIETPVIEYDSQFLSAPGLAVLRRTLNLESSPGSEFFDVVVIGGGITGMLSAIEVASRGLKCALLEQSTLGGNLLNINVFSHPMLSPVWKPSATMIDQLQEQMLKLGVEVILASKVSEIKKDGRIFNIKSLHKTYKALSVIIATGRKRVYPQLQNIDQVPPEYIIYNPVYADGIWKGKNTAIYAGDTESLAFAYRLSRS